MSNLKHRESVEQLRSHDHGKGTFEPLVSGLAPLPGQRIVYVDGGFDLFSSGHIVFLQTVSQLEHQLGEGRGWFSTEAKAQRIKDTGADYDPAYVIAGIHDDEVINYYKGINYPIMNIYERGLCVVQCRYIHCAIFGAPYSPSKSFLTSLPHTTNRTPPVDAVYHGPTTSSPTITTDPYADAKAMCVFVETPEHRFQEVNAAHIVRRILEKRGQYEERQRKKGSKAVGEEAARKKERERERRQSEVERQFGA